MPKPGDHQLLILSPNLLELTLITTKPPNPAPLTEWNFVTNFQFQSPALSQFNVTVNTQTVPLQAIGFKRRPIYAPLARRDLRIGNHLYLQLSNPIPTGATVRVENPSSQLWTSNVQFTAQSDPFRWNPAIHVNQEGYLPYFAKKAMIGFYLGSLGEMNISSSLGFNLIDDSSSNIVYQGTLTVRNDIGYVYNPPPYQQVLEADFTAFNAPGKYRVQVPGLGTSFPFYIFEGVAGSFARTYALGLYHQRCGAANQLPFTRHTHGPCHTNLVEVPTTNFAHVNAVLALVSADYTNNPRHTAPQLQSVASSLYPFVNTNNLDVSGGHHDAGDYSKYTINSAQLIHTLVFAADVFTNVGSLDNLGLPESGDGLSDVLQIAKWEADFLAKMQDADGGFYFLVYPRNRRYENDVLPDHGDSQVVFPKNTAATAAAVAALAQTASSPLFKTQFPQAAALYLAKAQQGWNFLQNAITNHTRDGSYQKITHYGDEFMHDDELAWAATELYLATGNSIYHTDLLAHFDPSDPGTLRFTWWRLFEGYGCAIRSYAFATRTGRMQLASLNSNFLAKCVNQVLASANDQVYYAQHNAYKSSFPDPNKPFRTAGWYFSLDQAFDIVTAYHLDPRQDYLDAIIGNMNYEGGCNPLNVSFLTGTGSKRQREIVHQYAQNDHRVLPPSGIPLGNIQQGFMYLYNYQTELTSLCFPADGATNAPYPFYDRWADTFNTMTEFVVPQQARGLACTAFLMARTWLGSQSWTSGFAQITGLPEQIPALENVTAHFDAPGVDLSEARIVWEARDQEPRAGAEFTFAPQNPGQQWVEAEAMLPDGRRLFAVAGLPASFSPNLPPNPYQSNSVPVTSDVVVLYHFDGNFADATGNHAALLVSGNATLDTNNVGWMAFDSGAALRVNDLGDNARVSIPKTHLHHTNTQTILLEAMIYVDGFKAYLRSNAPLVSLEEDYPTRLMLMDEMYDGPVFHGGAPFDIRGQPVLSRLTQNQWHHLRIALNRFGYSARIDGEIVAAKVSSDLDLWTGNGLATLTVGNFEGWLDEVVVRNVKTASNIHVTFALTGNQLLLHITGMIGNAFVIENSTDLINWTAIYSAVLTTDSYDFIILTDTEPYSFYRVIPVP